VILSLEVGETIRVTQSESFAVSVGSFAGRCARAAAALPQQ